MGAKITGADELIRDFEYATEHAVDETKAVVKRGAQNIKTDWRARWRGFAHAPALPDAVTYDVDVLASSVRGQIGPEKGRRQGALGNLLEYGSVNNPPHPGGSPALDAEEPRFVKALEDVAGDLLEGKR